MGWYKESAEEDEDKDEGEDACWTPLMILLLRLGPPLL